MSARSSSPAAADHMTSPRRASSRSVPTGAPSRRGATPGRASRRQRELARIARIAEADDVELGARLLRATPTNESREEEVLRSVSTAAQRFGAELAGAPRQRDLASDVVDRTGGLASDSPAVARYLPRRGRIEVFTDVVELCEDLVEELGWRELFPRGCVRAAALRHEEAHELVAHDQAAQLRRAVGVPALRIGRLTWWAHVAGTHELAAHAYAQAALGLRRSPLLLSHAAHAALSSTPRTAAPSPKEK